MLRPKILSFFTEPQIIPKPVIDPGKRFHIHDMHHTEQKIGTANTVHEAIDIAANDSLINKGRCYDICEGSCENKANKRIWFGDSWGIGQYYREHGNKQKRDEFAMHNAKRMFGENADIIPTDEPETFKVRF